MVAVEQVYLVHMLCSFFMCGIIWLVQIVHYPSFAFVEDSQFLDFEKFHTKRISYIVAPIMLLELVSAISLMILTDESFIKVNLSLLILIWLSTGLFSIPCHNELIRQKSPTVIERLIQTNWLRTLLWTVKSLLLFAACKYYL